MKKTAVLVYNKKLNKLEKKLRGYPIDFDEVFITEKDYVPFNSERQSAMLLSKFDDGRTIDEIAEDFAQSLGINYFAKVEGFTQVRIPHIRRHEIKKLFSDYFKDTKSAQYRSRPIQVLQV